MFYQQMAASGGLPRKYFFIVLNKVVVKGPELFRIAKRK